MNSFRNNYSIYEVKNCHNAETIWKYPHFPLSKKNSFRETIRRNTVFSFFKDIATQNLFVYLNPWLAEKGALGCSWPLIGLLMARGNFRINVWDKSHENEVLRNWNWYTYHKVASRIISQLVAHPKIFRLFMKGKCTVHALWIKESKIK